MKIALIILAAIFILLAVILAIPIRASVQFFKDEQANEKNIVIKYGFIKINLTKKKPKKEEKESEEAEEQAPKEKTSFEEKKRNLERYIAIFDKLKDDIADVLDYARRKAIVFEDVRLKSDFGFENAMYTGIFTGLYNAFVYNILGLINNCMTLDSMNIELNPKFDKPRFTIHFLCIVRLKTAHTVIVAIKVLKIYKKFKRERSK